MIAFHGKSALKAKYLKRVKAHAAADEIVHGRYWENGKGCAVGCTIHGSDHGAYETELGIPLALARLEDTLFEGQTNGKSKTFPALFLSAIKPGADLSCVHWKFLHWLLTEELAGRDHPLVRDAVKQCADVLVPLTKGNPAWSAEAATETARSARSAAEAARSARSAAEAAEAATETARSARSARSAMSAAEAARSAAEAARSAAEAAEAATETARSARSAAEAAGAVEVAVWSEAEAAYVRMADKLIALLRQAPVPKAKKAA